MPRLRLIGAGSYPGFCSMKRLEVFLLPLDGMLVHCRSLPHNLLGFPNNICQYSCVERGTVRVKCHAQEHNTMSLARARTQTARSGVECTNHEATVHPYQLRYFSMNNIYLLHHCAHVSSVPSFMKLTLWQKYM